MRQSRVFLSLASCLLAAVAIGASQGRGANDLNSAMNDQQPTTQTDAAKQSFSPTAAPGATEPKTGEEVAVLDTDQGQIVLKFFPDQAPGHVKNFKDLAKKGFYDGTRFHRTIPGFMIQGGDPNTKKTDESMWGTGDPGYKIKGEMNKTSHTRGILSMARSSDPDSAGSQFFITVADVPFLNPTFNANGKLVPGKEGYTVFGQVVQGMDVVDKIVSLPNSGSPSNTALQPVTVKSVKIEKWPLKKS